MAASAPAPVISVRPRPPQPRRWLVPLLVGMLLMAVGIWRWRVQVAEANAAASGPVQSVLHLDTFVLNLNDPEQRAYLRIGIEIGLHRPPAKADAAPLPVAAVRDALLAVLAARRVQDVLSVEGKEQLKRDLLTAVRGRAPELGAQEIYFTELLVQR
jgi:flagellar basal body-associated protein FliL